MYISQGRTFLAHINILPTVGIDDACDRGFGDFGDMSLAITDRQYIRGYIVVATKSQWLVAIILVSSFCYLSNMSQQGSLLTVVTQVLRMTD